MTLQIAGMTKTIKILTAFTVLLTAGCGEGTSNVFDEVGPAFAPALPATEVNNAAADGPMSPPDAFRLLEQATFGPQLDDITEAGRLGPETWINQEMQKPATYLSRSLQQGDSNRWNEYVNAWWRNSVQAEDQLRQRVAFALSQIFVVSSLDGLGDEQEGLANYYDLLLKYSFGNYRDLLEEITLNPIMGEYLSMKGNRRPDPEKNIQPDENYARELLQLFSIGLVQLNDDGTPKLDESGQTIPTYDQATIEGFAHLFTGWHFANADDFRWPSNSDYITPMTPWPEYHDTGEKKLLNGFVTAANQTPEEDLKQALDNVFNHPNVGPFISKQLIQRLVTSNPSPSYVRDVAAVFNSNAAGERGSLASTIKAILMHREARLGHLDNPDTYGKIKEPLLRVTQLWRAFGPVSIHREFNYAWAGNELAQSPLTSPSVFNFYRPDFAQPGAIRDAGLVSPEFQIIDETSIITITSRTLANTIWSHSFKSDVDRNRIAINIQREMDIEPDPDALLDHLDLLLLGGRMTPELRAETQALMDARDYQNAASQRVAEAIFLIASSPEAAIQQ